MNTFDFEQIKELVNAVMSSRIYCISISCGSDMINVSIYPYEGGDEE